MPPQDSPDDRNPPTRFAVALFPGFQALDVFGPLDILNMLSKTRRLSLEIYSATLDPVPTLTPSSGHSTGQSVVPTRTFADGADDIEVLLVPGGFGSRDPANVAPVVEFVRAAYPRLRRATRDFEQEGVGVGSLVATKATAQGPRVNWVRRARWVTDGNIWTSSGISAGIDMMYAFVGDQYGEDLANTLADASEYIRNTDPDFDPFAGKAENGTAK
ncbi:hypothetical protein Daesc_006557 [Daldinia eschscholtzii]|uniref:DJ-1/PfpI domain-containing protein n=1 Tax=Daldinia eschscholtzii TaxID=292717 RepID=A0AAX6MIN0_9PEZI